MIKFTLFISLLVKFIQAECLLPTNQFKDPSLKNFYEFGPRANDDALLKDDDHHYLVQKGINFKYFNKFYSAFYLSTNGVCELISNENEQFRVSENPKDFPIIKHALIAPFWADISTEIFGDVYYRLENDSEALDRISCDIKSAYLTFSNFKATWASVITWNQVKAHAYSRFSFNNTFQLVITTDGFYSFAIFNYGKLTWPNLYIKKFALAGFNSGDNKTFSKFNGSFTNDIVNLSKESNINVPSKYIFRVDHKERNIEAFIKFGTQMNDSLLAKTVDSSFGPIQIPESKVRIARRTFLKSLFVYQNGYVTLNKPYTADTMPTQNKPKKLPLRDSISLISPFWTQLNLLANGDVYFRQVKDKESLAQISHDVSLKSLNQFDPEWAFVVTYYEIAESKSTFQLILTFDSNSSFYAIFNYNQVNKTESNDTIIGYNLEMRDGYSELNKSVSKLVEDSNVNQTGKYVFLLSQLDEEAFKNTKNATKTTDFNNMMSKRFILEQAFFYFSVAVALIGLIVANIMFWTHYCKKKNKYTRQFNVIFKNEENDLNTLIPKKEYASQI